MTYALRHCYATSLRHVDITLHFRHAFSFDDTLLYAMGSSRRRAAILTLLYAIRLLRLLLLTLRRLLPPIKAMPLRFMLPCRLLLITAAVASHYRYYATTYVIGHTYITATLLIRRYGCYTRYAPLRYARYFDVYADTLIFTLRAHTPLTLRFTLELPRDY